MSTSSAGTTDSFYSSVTSEGIIYVSDNKRNLTVRGGKLNMSFGEKTEEKQILNSTQMESLCYEKEVCTRCTATVCRVNSTRDVFDLESISSIEDENIELKTKYELLEQRCQLLMQNLLTAEMKNRSFKEENSNLVKRIHMLEDELNVYEAKTSQMMEEEKKNSSVLITNMKRENSIEVEDLIIKTAGLENENKILFNDVSKLKRQLSQSKEIAYDLNANIGNLLSCLDIKEEVKTSMKMIPVSPLNIPDRKEPNGYSILKCSSKLNQNDSGIFEKDECSSSKYQSHRIFDLETEVQNLKEQNKFIKKKYEEIKNLLFVDQVIFDDKTSLENSLAKELNAVPTHELNMNLKEMDSQNKQLRQYINRVLVTILERDPSMLEVRN